MKIYKASGTSVERMLDKILDAVWIFVVANTQTIIEISKSWEPVVMCCCDVLRVFARVCKKSSCKMCNSTEDLCVAFLHIINS